MVHAVWLRISAPDEFARLPVEAGERGGAQPGIFNSADPLGAQKGD